MAQGFKFQVKNVSTEVIYVWPNHVDDCMDPDPGFSATPLELQPNTSSDELYCQVKWDCDDGKFNISFTPGANQENNDTGNVTLSFDKASTEVYPNGVVLITGFKRGVTGDQSITIYPSVELSNSGEWTLGTVVLSTTLDPSVEGLENN